MHERIKNIRKHFGLTQQDFADRIGVKRNTIATYEIGRSIPIDAVISLICREFGVDEVWLRTGVGEMFSPRSLSDDLAVAAGMLGASDPNDPWTRMVMTLISIPEKDREAVIRTLTKIANALLEEQNKKDEA